MKRTDAISQKILSASQLEAWLARARLLQKRIVFTNGCFDLLHRGHLHYLAEARDHGDLLLVGLNSDASVARLKGPDRPLNTAEDRAFALASLSVVDGVMVFEEDTPAELIQRVQPDVLVKGGDYRPDEVVGREYAGELVLIPFVDGFSTTGLIQKMNPDGQG